MASLLLGAGALAYDQVQKSRAKKKARIAHNNARFSALERENANRIAHLQQNTCFCQRSDWKGGACEVHGYVPPASAGYDDDDDDERGNIPPSEPPAYGDVAAPHQEAQQRQGQGPDAWSAPSRQREIAQAESPTEGGSSRPPPIKEEEIERINEKRRKKGQGKKVYKNLFRGKSRRAGDQGNAGGN